MERYCLEDEEETRATERAKMKDPQVKIDVLYKEKSRCRPLFLNFLITVTFPSGYFFFLWHFVSLMRARWLHKCEQPSEARRLSSRKGRRMPWQRNGPTVKVISGKDGRWEGRYTAGHNPETRKLIYKNVLGRTQAEAKNKLKAAIEETKSLDVTKAGKYTVGTWMDEWFENYAKIKARPSPHQTYRGYINNHIKSNIGKVPLEKLTSLELQKFCKKLLTSGRIDRVESKNQAKGLSPKKAYRTLPLAEDTIQVLKQQKKKAGSSLWVFPGPTGGPISPDSVLHILHPVLKRAGLPRVRFHDLRHTFAMLALQNGVDIKTVSGMLGHFSAGFTLDTYAHVTTAAQKEAARTMEKVLTAAS